MAIFGTSTMKQTQTGKYLLYPLLVEELHRMAKRVAKARKHKTKPTVQSAIKATFRMMPEMVHAMDAIIFAEESYWLKHERIIIFPESTDVLERLARGKFNITHPASVRMPHEAFVLAFPKGFTIAGQQAEGCLVTWLTPDDRDEKMLRPFFDEHDIGFDRSIRSTPVEGAMLTLTYTTQPPEGAESSDRAYARAVIPQQFLPDILACESAQEYADILNRNGGLGGAAFDLTSDEHQYQFELVKLIAALAVYSNAAPDALRPGFPGERPKHLEYREFERFSDRTLSTVGPTGAHDSPDAHVRTWHFRTLVNERYYRGEYAHLQPGSRVVFVNETVVGLKDVQPETLTESEQG